MLCRVPSSRITHDRCFRSPRGAWRSWRTHSSSDEVPRRLFYKGPHRQQGLVRLALRRAIQKQKRDRWDMSRLENQAQVQPVRRSQKQGCLGTFDHSSLRISILILILRLGSGKDGKCHTHQAFSFPFHLLQTRNLSVKTAASSEDNRSEKRMMNLVSQNQKRAGMDAFGATHPRLFHREPAQACSSRSCSLDSRMGSSPAHFTHSQRWN